MTKPTLLDKVRAKLATRKGKELTNIAAATGMSYATILRIRDDATDPPFSKVQQIAEYFRVVRQ
jgi:predicted transcriptional regulator